MDVRKQALLFKQKTSNVGIMDYEHDIAINRVLSRIRVLVSCIPHNNPMDSVDIGMQYCCYNINIKAANGTLIASKTKTMNFIDNTIDFEVDVNQYVSIVEFATSGASGWNGDWKVKFDVIGY